jgi:hypothetical protein
MPKTPSTTRSQRPKALTVFTAAFVAGAVAAVGINRALDVHLAQAKPQVECEPIFVALRDLAQGSPVTIWDVALRDWPKAMLPTTALRADDRFEGMLVKHPVREGQPLLSVQLMKAEARAIPADAVEHVAETYAPRTFQPAPASQPDADLWAATHEPTPQALADAKPVVAPHHDVVASEPVVTEETISPIKESTPPATLAAEAAFPPAEITIPEPIPAPMVDEVVTTADIPPSAAVEEPAPMASVDQSTARTPAQPETPAEPSEPVQSVTQAEPESTPAQPVAATPRRYLVVPERIAIQAEASFTSPAPQTEPQPEPTEGLAQPPQAQPSPAEVVQQKQAPATKPTTQGSTARSKAVPRVAQAPTLETHPNTEPQQPVSALDGLFPNLRATFGAVDEEMQKIRQQRAAQERTAQERQQAGAAQGRQQPSQKQKQQPPQQNNQPPRSARWPWSFGR